MRVRLCDGVDGLRFKLHRGVAARGTFRATHTDMNLEHLNGALTPCRHAHARREVLVANIAECALVASTAVVNGGAVSVNVLNRISFRRSRHLIASLRAPFLQPVMCAFRH